MNAIVIGSGPTGSNVALTLLEKGFDVEVWDVGKDECCAKSNNAGFIDFKNYDGINKYFLGNDFEGLISPISDELFKVPVNRDYLVQSFDSLYDVHSSSFHPAISYSKGGLANGWGANVGAYKDNDVIDWPLEYADLFPYYEKVYRRIGITSSDDHLSKYIDTGFETQEPIKLSEQDEILLSAAQRKYNESSSIIVGRSRIPLCQDSCPVS